VVVVTAQQRVPARYIKRFSLNIIVVSLLLLVLYNTLMHYHASQRPFRKAVRVAHACRITL
jgi:hypothetical protein